MSEKKQTREVVIRGSGGIEVSRDEKEDVSEGGYVTGDEGFHRLRCDNHDFMLIYFIGSGS